MADELAEYEKCIKERKAKLIEAARKDRIGTLCICGAQLRGLHRDLGGTCDYDIGFVCTVCERTYSYWEWSRLEELFKLFIEDFGFGHEMEWSNWLKYLKELLEKEGPKK